MAVSRNNYTILESIMLHHDVSTVALNGQTKRWL